MRPRRQSSVALGVLLAPLALVTAASAEVISLLSQDRSVTARATVSPTNPPGPDQSADQTHQAPDFGAFDAAANAALGMGGAPLATAAARQTSSIVGALVHAEGDANATGVCEPPLGCGAGDASSRFAIRFTVPVSMHMRIIGGVSATSGAPRLRFAILGPGVTLVSDGEGGSDAIDLEALLTPGEYALEALVEATSGEAGAFLFDATFDAVLVGAEATSWSAVKQLFR